AVAVLQGSKDLRALAYLAVAKLWEEGLPAFLGFLPIAASWLEDYWEGVRPLVEDDGGQVDAVARQNALSCFADPMAVLYQVRRSPLIVSRVHGRFNFSDIDTLMTPVPGAAAVTASAQLAAAVGDTPSEDLQSLHSCLEVAIG